MAPLFTTRAAAGSFSASASFFACSGVTPWRTTSYTGSVSADGAVCALLFAAHAVPRQTAAASIALVCLFIAHPFLFEIGWNARAGRRVDRYRSSRPAHRVYTEKAPVDWRTGCAALRYSQRRPDGVDTEPGPTRR